MIRHIAANANSFLLSALVVILVLVSAATWDRFNAAQSARLWSQHTHNVLMTIKDLELEVHGAETGQRGFLLTGDPKYLAPYNEAAPRIEVLESKLQRLTADNPAEQERLGMLTALLQQKMAELARTVRLRLSAGPDAAMQDVRTDAGRVLMTKIEAVLNQMTDAEQRLLATRLAEAANRTTTTGRLALAATAISVLGLIFAAFMLSRAWSRSRVAEHEQHVIAQQLRISLDSLSQGVGVFSPDWHLINWNQCFQDLLGVPEAMIRTGVPYGAFVGAFPGQDGTALETEEQVRHGQSRPDEPITYEATRADGRLLEIRRTPTPDGGFVLTLTDMTKRAQAEAVLRESQKMQAIGQLTGGMAHDFNNLLTVILGNLELARAKMKSDASLLPRIDRATWAAQRGATLTSQLLAFARRQPLKPVPIDLAATIPEMVPILRRTLGEHIDVRYVETAGLWPAMADAAQLESAVLNLALNARDSMPDGGRLTIELGNRVLDEAYARSHAEVRPGDYTMLAVSDTGCGMTPDVLARVFEPFFTTKTEGSGTGLGLAMVFGFIKQSDGHIAIYSEPGEGTTVRLYLPRAIAATAEAGQRGGAPVQLPHGSATVLVVEDEAAVREIVMTILGDLGYRVLGAASGEEGLRVFAEHADEVDLLLTDVVLPGKVRGRALADNIVALRPEVRVLFMSGYTENAIVHHGRLDDGVQLLGKPFKREELARKVADVLAAGASAAAGDS